MSRKRVKFSMSVAERVLKSSGLILFVRLIQRSIGLVSILILARILTPEDFGVVSIASVVVFFFDVLTESGTRQYIIHKEHTTEDDINTAWSLNLLIKLGIFLVVIVIAPMVADFFDNAALVIVFQFIAL